MKTTAAQSKVLATVVASSTPCACLDGRATLSADALARAGLIEIVETHYFNYFVKGIRRVETSYSVRITEAGRAAL